MADWSCRAPTKHPFRLLALVATLAILAAACTGDNHTANRDTAVPDDQTATGRPPANTQGVPIA